MQYRVVFVTNSQMNPSKHLILRSLVRDQLLPREDFQGLIVIAHSFIDASFIKCELISVVLLELVTRAVF